MTKKEEDVAISDQYLNGGLVLSLECIPEGKKLFYRFCKKWREFLDALDKEDRLILLKMILGVYGYN
jgi:hypothetical protein